MARLTSDNVTLEIGYSDFSVQRRGSMGIKVLLTALPLSGIESDWLARLSGFIPKGPDDTKDMAIYFLEPPTCKKVPYIDPVEAMMVL